MAVEKKYNFRDLLYVTVSESGACVHIDKGQGRCFCGRTWSKKAGSHQPMDRCSTCLKLSREGPKR